MILQDLLAFEDYKDGLKALYTEYDLELGYKQEEGEEELYSKYPDYLEDETTTEEERQEYIQDNLAFREANTHIKSNYGWDMSELWNLDSTIFQFLLPRLYIFYKTDLSLAQDFGEDGTFKDVLECILEALLSVTPDKDGFESLDEDEAKVSKAMALFGKYIRRLWN